MRRLAFLLIVILSVFLIVIWVRSAPSTEASGSPQVTRLSMTALSHSKATPAPLVLPPPTLQTAGCTPVVSRVRAENAPQNNAITRYDPGDGQAPVEYIARQVIVTGKSSDIDEVVNRVLSQMQLTLSEPPEKIGTALLLKGVPLEIRLYRLRSSGAGADVARAVLDQIRLEAKNQQRLVLADLNYVGASPLSGEASPLSGEASPLSGEASPLSGEASPLSGEASPFGPDAATPLELYWRQWALADPDIGGIDLTNAGVRRTDLPAGKTTRIVILDTSPFGSSSSPYRQPRSVIFSGKGWPKPTLRICVQHPVDVTLANETGTLWDQADHGVFVAGLAHAVAPASELHLVRVLDQHGKGELADVLYVLSALNRAGLPKTVVNMSLGFVPLPSAQPALRQAVCHELGLQACDLPALVDEYKRTKNLNVLEALEYDSDLASLEAEIASLGQSSLIAAAAGNASSRGDVKDPQFPAAFATDYPAVLAVAASDHNRERSFYSNRGNIVAPGGGDNGKDCDRPTPGRPATCWRGAEYWLISIAQHRNPRPLSSYWSYGAWVGTSFATPLVSGMAADLLETLSGPPGSDPANVAARVRGLICRPGIICFPVRWP